MPFNKITEINVGTFVVPVQKAVESTTNYYYQKINPIAGIEYFENKYKTQLDEADKYMNDANTVMTELLGEGAVNRSNDEIVKALKSKKDKLLEVFSMREKSLNAIVATDDLGYEMSLPTAQKEFYKKRKLADENEIKAFQIYRISKVIYMDGYLVYSTYWKLFHEITNPLVDQKNTELQNKSIASKFKEFGDYYNSEVKKAKEDTILSPEIFDEMDQGYEMVDRVVAYDTAYALDPNSQDTKDKAIYLEQGLSQRKEQPTDLYQKWVDKYVAPGQYIQKELHDNSFKMISQAYEYAKKQNMKGVFSVWKDKYPGYDYVSEKQKTGTTTLTQEQKNQYYELYNEPYIIFIRTALNEYLKGDINNTIPKEAKTKSSDADFIFGLDSFDSSYYKSKFVVILNEDFVNGGIVSTIVFQDKPDKFFTAWTYEKTKGNYLLRGFWSPKIQDEDYLKRLSTDLKELMFDKVHAL